MTLVPHTVQLSNATFARLQGLAEPLVDTIESVIVGLLDRDQGRSSVKPSGNGDIEGTEDADQLPQMTCPGSSDQS